MKIVIGTFITAVVAMLAGTMAIVTFIASDPATLCQQSLYLAQQEQPGLPTAREWSPEQTATTQSIVGAMPQADPELVTVAVAVAIATTDLSSNDGAGGVVNPLTGSTYEGTLTDAITLALTDVTAYSQWRTRPAGEVVAAAVGKPGEEFDDAWEQASLLVADATTTDVQHLLEQANTDINCVAAQMAMPNVVTVDGISYPVPGYTNISSRYGWRMHPIFHTLKLHAGVDFPAPCGSGIVPVQPGLVIRTDESIAGLGTLVEILHADGTTTIYGHMFPGTIYVREGDQVVEGQRIADIGSAGDSTGCHLHIELHDPSGKAMDIGAIYSWY